MVPMLKKPRQNEVEFMDLNDDCIRHILWKLSPTDLCSMSFVCERMQRLAFDHFPRQYSSKKITIAMGILNMPYIRNSQNHLKYFSKCIQNIRIDSPGTGADIQSLFDFVRTECCAELRTLELSVGGCLRACNTEVIKSNLKNLSTLHIEQPLSRYDIYHVLLQHCKNIQHLILVLTSTSFVSTWMQHSYPTLTRITIKVTSKKQIKQFVLFAKTFLQLNPQIKQFTLSQNNIIKSVLTNATKIEELTVRFTGWKQLQPLVDLFKECKPNDIQKLKLSIEPCHTTMDDVNALQSLNAIQPIRSLSCFLIGWTSKATFLSQFKFLEELYLHIPQDYGNEEDLLTILSEQLPNMQDLRFNFNGRERMFKEVAMKFIKNSLKLKFLNFVMCYNNTFIFHANDLVALNECRASLRCGVPIKVRMDYDDYENFEQPTFIQPAISVMNIQFVSMWRDNE